jgi:pimeloyl-ACP methyl ester carboxylesterase
MMLSLLFAFLMCLIDPPATQTVASQSAPRPHAPAAPSIQKPAQYQAVVDPHTIDRFPYQRHFTTDRFDRLITFYVSKDRPAKDGEPLIAKPLAICIQGSGSQSVFLAIDTQDGPRIVSGGPDAAVMKHAGDRLRVVVVEKPGVEFLASPARPGSAEEGTSEFRQEHTLERWTEALHAATLAALSLPNIDGTRLLAVGHSEGGLVACELASIMPQATHVATLAGGGATQLFDLIELARTGSMGPPLASTEDRVAWILDGWKRVLADPDSADALWLGHPHRRWSSFLVRSPIQALRETKVRVFIGQGTNDRATSTTGSDALFAELLAHGRDATYRRVDGGDHAFLKPDQPEADGWLDMYQAVAEWFLGESLGDGPNNPTKATPPASTSSKP